MRPATTTYRLAHSGGEYNRLYALMTSEGFPRQPLKWPVVVAEREGRVVGFLATHGRDDAIVAGPLVIEGGRNMLMFLRLVEAYDNVLRFARISSYLFTVDKCNSAQVARVKGVGIRQVGEDDSRLWFKRDI